MQARYALRFDSGERKGEQVSISGAGVTIGRKPGNSVQLLDGSVSGRHAEFSLDSNGVVLRDLGSTNGTKVGGERVSERRLEHGDAVLLGNVRLTFLDTQRPAPEAAAVGGPEQGGLELELEGEGADPVQATRPSAFEAARAGEGAAASAAARESASAASSSVSSPSSSQASNQTSGDAVRTISADKVARSKRLSVASGLFLLAAIGAGAGGWWWLRGRETASGAGVARAVEVTPGNLLGASFSFEAVELDGEDSPWANDAAAAAVFTVDGGSRRSGDFGVGAVLSAGQSALLRSKPIAVGSTRKLALTAFARVDGAARARVGLEFEASSGASARTLVWSPAAAAGEGFETLEWSCDAPPGFDLVRVVLGARATGEGAADFDDLVLLAGGDPAPALAQDSLQLVALGAPATAAVLFKIDRTLVSDLHARGADGERLELSAAPADGAFLLSVGAAATSISLRADGALTATAPVTLGEGGYRSHGASFEREGLSRLVLGAGKDLIALGFDTPVRVQARAEGSGLRLEFNVSGAARLKLQVGFRAERESALGLAREAREAERAGRLGESIALWTRLRDETPFDTELLAEGEATRARLVEGGVAEARNLRAEIERARFFRLVELFRQCRERAESLGRRFAGSELAGAAAELVREVRTDLDLLEADLNKAERARLESIERALSAAQNDRLAQRVRTYRQELAGARGAANGGGQ